MEIDEKMAELGRAMKDPAEANNQVAFLRGVGTELGGSTYYTACQIIIR